MAEVEFTIRAISESDLSEWLRLRMMLWDESSEDEHKIEMVDIFEDSDSQLVVVADVNGGHLAGFLEASIRSHVEDCETDYVGYLEGWFVEKDFRLSGMGRRLVGYAEQWARQKGCVEMASDAEIDDVVCQQAHDQFGYLETSRLVHLRKELV